MAKLQIAMDKKQKRALQKMADDLETDIPGVLQMSFAMLKIALREHKAGNQLAVTKDNKIIKEIIGIW